ncbi:hypothetical protein P3S67_002110 [Capsicum chacoense]
MHFGVPLIVMPFNIDQFLTAKYEVELGIALEVRRDKNVRVEREQIVKAIRNVIVEKKGEELRAKSAELSVKIREKEKQDVEEEVMEELKKLCLMNKNKKSVRVVSIDVLVHVFTDVWLVFISVLVHVFIGVWFGNNFSISSLRYLYDPTM